MVWANLRGIDGMRNGWVIALSLVGAALLFASASSFAKEFRVGEDLSNKEMDHFFHKRSGNGSIDVPSFPSSIRVAVTANDPRAFTADDLIKEIFNDAGVEYLADVSTTPPYLRVIFADNAIENGKIQFDRIPATVFSSTIAVILSDAARTTLHGHDCAPAAIRIPSGELYGAIIVIDKNVSDNGVQDCVLHGVAASLGIELRDLDANSSLAETKKFLHELINRKKSCLKENVSDAACFTD